MLPAYHEEKNIPLVVDAIFSHMQKLDIYDFEVIFVNDWSTDNTRNVVASYASKDPRIKWINLSRNFWHQAALTAWLEYATGDAIVSMDCDLQHPIDVAIKMIREREKWYEVVYARVVDRNVWWLKKYSSKQYYKLLSLISDTEIPRNVWDFRLIDKKVLKSLNDLPEKAKYLRWMVARLWYKSWFVNFIVPSRIHWSSSYSIVKMLRLAMDWILNFSTFPLRVWMIFGILMIMIASLFLAYMVIDNLLNWVPYELFKWISVFWLGFMWLQFIFIWIVGEYVWRIYNEARNRPIYVPSNFINLEIHE